MSVIEEKLKKITEQDNFSSYVKGPLSQKKCGLGVLEPTRLVHSLANHKAYTKNGYKQDILIIKYINK